MPKFLNGKNNADLAPITTFILFVDNPLQIIFLFFFVIDECQIAGLKPKKSINFFSNSFVNPISGNKIKAWKPFSIFFLIASKYTIVLPDPVVPWSTCVLNFSSFLTKSLNASSCYLLNS